MSILNWFKRAEPEPIVLQPTITHSTKRADQRMLRIQQAIEQGDGTPELLAEYAALQEKFE